MSDEPRKTAILRFSNEMLRVAFDLPEGVEIMDARVEFGVTGEMQVVVQGAGFSTPPGCPPMSARPIIHHTHDETGVLTWRHFEWKFE